MKRLLLCLVPVAMLAACAPAPEIQLGPDGRPAQQVYRISSGDSDEIQFRMLDAVNALRSADGLSQLELSPRLNAAAATHARDMAVQNRPWHFGSDGSSPLERANRAGYAGSFRGEVISETYESELETLAAWMAEPNTRRVLLDPEADEMGFQWFQEQSGKIWWTLVTGSRAFDDGPLVFGADVTG